MEGDRFRDCSKIATEALFSGLAYWASRAPEKPLFQRRTIVKFNASAVDGPASATPKTLRASASGKQRSSHTSRSPSATIRCPSSIYFSAPELFYRRREIQTLKPTPNWAVHARNLHSSRENWNREKTVGGGGGIRTHETLSGLTVFKTAAIGHSATPP